MKNVYIIGTVQYFTYPSILLFKRKTHWILRNVKPVYAYNKKEAIEKYRLHFYKKYNKIKYECRNWYSRSDDSIDITMSEIFVKIIKTDVVELDISDIYTFDDYQKNMTGNDFKEWWFDNKIDNDHSLKNQKKENSDFQYVLEDDLTCNSLVDNTW